jgi:hypothetical protein
VVARVDDVVSNFASLSIASSGDICMDVNGLSGADLEKLQAGGSISAGTIGLYLSFDCGDYDCGPGITPSYVEGGNASFSRSGLLSLFGQTRPGLPAAGSCSVAPPPTPSTSVFVPPVPLDTGPVLNLTGPKGNQQLAMRFIGSYSTEFSVGANQIKFLEPGDYVVDNGAGGADVGPFRAALTIPTAFTSTVQRSAAGVRVTWTGGTPSGIVIMEGTGAPGPNGAIARFTCAERAAAGQFTLPTEVLLSLPADTPDHAGLNVSAYSPTTTVFRARGLDFGQFSFAAFLP